MLFMERGMLVSGGDGGWGTPQFLFEGHVMLACLRGC